MGFTVSGLRRGLILPAGLSHLGQTSLGLSQNPLCKGRAAAGLHSSGQTATNPGCVKVLVGDRTRAGTARSWEFPLPQPGFQNLYFCQTALFNFQWAATNPCCTFASWFQSLLWEFCDQVHSLVNRKGASRGWAFAVTAISHHKAPRADSCLPKPPLAMQLVQGGRGWEFFP